MKTPEPRKLPSGSWFTRVTVDGVVYSVTEATPELCAAKAMAIKAGMIERKKKKTLPTLQKSLNDYMSARGNTLSPSTIRGYDTISRTRFKAYMSENLLKFTDEYCQSMIDSEAVLCSAKTLKNAWRFVSAAIFKSTGKRPIVTLPQAVPPDFKFLDYQQIEKFLKGIKGKPVEIPALLALSSLRRSEIMALDWKNVDLEKGQIKVKGAMVYNKEQKLTLKKTNKNRTSSRTVPILMPQLADALKACPDKQGAVVWQKANTLLDEVKRACKAAGVPEVGVHALRHSFASLGYHLGVPEKIIMEIGGWSNDATMHRIYTHVAQSDMAYYENRMQKYYQKCNEKCNKKKRV